MIYKKVGDMDISSIVLGTDTFGTLTDRECAFALMDKFCGLGGNTIDTARVYGCHNGGSSGDSERVIGEWLKSRNMRGKVIISTKCAHPRLETMGINRLSKNEIEADVDASLSALGIERIDILWLHRDDKNVNADGIIDVLDGLVKKGKVHAFGTSNWTTERICEANKYAGENGKSMFSASQIKWSAARSAPDYADDPTLVEMDAEQYGYYKKTKMPVFAFASQAKGFFHKYCAGGEAALSPKARQRYLCEENIKRSAMLAEICGRYGISLSAAVVAALTSNTEFDTAAIVGCKNTMQLEDTMCGADCVLDYDEVKKIFGF